MEYRVIFSGTFNDSVSSEQIKINLMRLFNASDAEITERFFSGNKTVIAENLTEEVADNYVTLIRKAGAGATKELQIDLDAFQTPVAVEKSHVHKSIYGYGTNTSLESDVPKIATFKDTKEPYQHATLPETYRKGGISANPGIKIKYVKPSRSYMPLFTTDIRIGRIRFISRLLAFLVIPQLIVFALLTTNTLSKITNYFTSFDGLTLGIIMTAAIVIYLAYLAIIFIQRLNDLNLGAKWLAVLLAPIIVLTFSLAMNKVGQIQQEQRNMANDVANHISTIPGRTQTTLSAEKLEKTFKTDTLKFVQSLNFMLTISFYISMLVFLALILAPGSKGTNSFADPSPQVGPVSFAFIFFALLFLGKDFLGPRLFPDQYKLIKDKENIIVIESVFKILEKQAPIPDDIKAEFYNAAKGNRKPSSLAN